MENLIGELDSDFRRSWQPKVTHEWHAVRKKVLVVCISEYIFSVTRILHPPPQ